MCVYLRTCCFPCLDMLPSFFSQWIHIHPLKIGSSITSTKNLSLTRLDAPLWGSRIFLSLEHSQLSLICVTFSLYSDRFTKNLKYHWKFSYIIMQSIASVIDAKKKVHGAILSRVGGWVNLPGGIRKSWGPYHIMPCITISWAYALYVFLHLRHTHILFPFMAILRVYSSWNTTTTIFLHTQTLLKKKKKEEIVNK